MDAVKCYKCLYHGSLSLLKSLLVYILEFVCLHLRRGFSLFRFLPHTLHFICFSLSTWVASMRSSSTINQRTDSCTDSSFFRLQLTVAEVYIEGGQGGQSTSGNWQLTLFKPWGVDYARHSTASPPGFKMLSTPLSSFIAGNF